MTNAQGYPIATICLFAKLRTQNFPNSAYHENEIWFLSWCTPRVFIGPDKIWCQNLSLCINIQDLKIFKQSNKRTLFNDFSNRSTFMGHQVHTLEESSETCWLPGDSKWRESPDDADIVWRLFTQILIRLIANFSPSIREDIPVNLFALRNHLKNFPDAFMSHKTSTNLSVRAYFRQFSDW